MLEIDAAQAIFDLNAMVARIREPAVALAMIGRYEVAQTKSRIESLKEDPFDVAWAPWAAVTAIERQEKGTDVFGLLWDTGALLDSIHFELEGASVAIGSDLDYALYLQEGTDEPHKMPARPFLGWSPGGLEAHEALLVEFFDSGELP